MLKKTLLLLLSFLTLNANIQCNQNNEEDHIPHWNHFFSVTKIRGFLECGIGSSTKYFLEHAEKVISVEYITPGYGDSTYQQYYSLFHGIDNWIPVLYNKEFRSNSFNNACAYQCCMHQDYAQIDTAYLRELSQHFKMIIHKAESENYPIDVAFVHTTLYIRGDFVKLLLAHEIPIIVAHGTLLDNGSYELKNLYGWNKVITPPNYVKIYLPWGQGTTFWISENLPHMIDSIQEYKNQMIGQAE